MEILLVVSAVVLFVALVVLGILLFRSIGDLRTVVRVPPTPAARAEALPEREERFRTGVARALVALLLLGLCSLLLQVGFFALLYDRLA